MLNQDFKTSYWPGTLVKHVYVFGIACDEFRSRSPHLRILFAPETRITLNSFNYVAYRKTIFFPQFIYPCNSIYMISLVLPLPALTETGFDSILNSFYKKGPVLLLKIKNDFVNLSYPTHLR
jgi:hypothetical protein